MFACPQVNKGYRSEENDKWLNAWPHTQRWGISIANKWAQDIELHKTQIS